MIIAEDRRWKVQADSFGIIFSFSDPNVFEAGSFSRADSQTQERAALLRVLEEQGEASRIHGGMHVLWNSACRLTRSVRELLELPNRWPGSLVLQVRGRSSDSDFDLDFKFHRPNGNQERGVFTKGGLTSLGSSQYLADTLQYAALAALEEFKQSRSEGKLDQYTALSTLQRLQAASNEGLDIDLEAYRELTIEKPDAVRVSLEEREDGGLKLSPDLCKKTSGHLGADSVVDPDEFDKRIDEYVGDRETACVPVGKKLLLLDEKAVQAIREITRNRDISAQDRESFLKEPTAWLNAEVVDLDLGFSDRVRGAGPLRVAYFGETDKSGIEWVDADESEKEPSKGDGTDSLEYDDDLIEEEETDEGEPVVLDIELSDEGESAEELRNREAPPSGIMSQCSIDQSVLLRKPFPHQEEAIRWLMALSMDDPEGTGWSGGLLADDMGLGKTFTVLVFLQEFLKAKGGREEAGPVIIVAPVSLLSVWKKEIEKTYKQSPFNEVITLHSSEDLPKYKLDGAGREIHASEPEANAGNDLSRDDLTDGIRYALRVPEPEEPAHPNCIGLPGSVIITNYETVRDYQFSLARIPWSVVVLDEAQSVKNPNAMATRAVKALQAEFTVVMTGTPVENSLKDFWCLMDRVAPGFLNNFQPFRREYMAPIVAARRSGNNEELVKKRNEIGEALRERVGGLMLRRLKEDHLENLPKKEIILHKETGDQGVRYDERILCEMSGEQKQLYEEICSLDFNRSDSDATETKQCILGAIQHLRAVSLHPDLVLKDSLPRSKKASEAREQMKRSAKLELLVSILDTIKANNEKVLIFLINKKLQVFLQNTLQLIYRFENPPGIINGDTKVRSSKRSASSSRTELIEAFSKKDGFGILILSPVAAGVGLTITEANHVIHLERHWNPAKEAQATDRVYRIGQKRPVSVWVPILTHPTRKSFDENLDQLLSMKSGLSNAVVTPEAVDPGEMEGLLGFGNPSEAKVTVGEKDLRGMKWEYFEALIALLLESDGAEKVILTGKQGDKGCDVVALGWRGENWLVQCKHKSNPAGPVGRKCVQEVVGSRAYMKSKLQQDFRKLAVFATVKNFDRDAKEFAKLESAELFGLKEIRRLLPKQGVLLSALIQRDNNRESV